MTLPVDTIVVGDYKTLARCNVCQLVIPQQPGTYYPLSGLPAPKCPACPKGVLRAMSTGYSPTQAAADREARLHPPRAQKARDTLMLSDPPSE